MSLIIYSIFLDLIVHEPPLIDTTAKGFHVELGSRINYLSLSSFAPEKRISHYSRILHPVGFFLCVLIV
jgi:hypothetical protein